MGSLLFSLFTQRSKINVQRSYLVIYRLFYKFYLFETFLNYDLYYEAPLKFILGFIENFLLLELFYYLYLFYLEDGSRAKFYLLQKVVV